MTKLRLFMMITFGWGLILGLLSFAMGSWAYGMVLAFLSIEGLIRVSQRVL